ncbi:MAG: hypothetical protein P8M17_08130, partial [Saprospiraceae bacterium]|nr:hypothetical protein [Saprospiraceae bacterium]
MKVKRTPDSPKKRKRIKSRDLVNVLFFTKNKKLVNPHKVQNSNKGVIEKIKSIPLKVSAPFHCSLMKPAAESMADKINNT